jgi:hypothetical protein
MKEWLKNMGWSIIGLVIFIVIPVLLAGAFLLGATWLSLKALPWLYLASYLAFGFTLFILLPLTIFRRTRAFAGSGLIIASYIFGLNLWCFSFILTLALWGFAAVIIGLMIAGVGVVPVALLATGFNAEWGRFIDITFLLVLTFGCRFLGFYIEKKAKGDVLFVWED